MPALDLILYALLIAVPSALSMASLISGSGTVNTKIVAWPLIALMGGLGVRHRADLDSSGSELVGTILMTFFTLIAVLILLAAIAASSARRQHEQANPQSVEALVIAAAATPALAALCGWFGSTDGYLTMLLIFLPILASLARWQHAAAHPKTPFAGGLIGGAMGVSLIAHVVSTKALSGTNATDQTSFAGITLLVSFVLTAVAVAFLVVISAQQLRISPTRSTITPLWRVALVSFAIAAVLHLGRIGLYFAAPGTALDVVVNIETVVWAVAALTGAAGWVLHDIRRAHYESDSCDSAPAATN